MQLESTRDDNKENGIGEEVVIGVRKCFDQENPTRLEIGTSCPNAGRRVVVLKYLSIVIHELPIEKRNRKQGRIKDLIVICGYCYVFTTAVPWTW